MLCCVVLCCVVFSVVLCCVVLCCVVLRCVVLRCVVQCVVQCVVLCCVVLCCVSWPLYLKALRLAILLSTHISKLSAILTLPSLCACLSGSPLTFSALVL